MGWKRILTVLTLVGIAPGFGPIALSADSDDDSKEKNKGGVRLFVEAAGGSMTADAVNSSINTSTLDFATSELNLDDSLFGRAAIGWELNPKTRGRFVLRYEAFTETGWSFNSNGYQSEAEGASSVSGPVVWWTVNADEHGTTSVKSIPSWSSANDTNMDGQASPDEVQYLENPEDRLTIQSPAPRDLQNRLQTIDVLFERRFGGRFTRARWTAGLRYYVYDGNVPAAAWLNLNFIGVGFTDGGVLRLMTLNQEASGWGPSFSLQLEHSFVRDRLVIYGNAAAAFIIQDISTDSGTFTTLIFSDGDNSFLTVPAELKRSTNKDSWQLGLEVGLQFEVVEGFNFYLSYLVNSFHDVVFLPSSIIIPESEGEAGQGVSGVFNSHDLIYDGGVFGFSFQF